MYYCYFKLKSHGNNCYNVLLLLQTHSDTTQCIKKTSKFTLHNVIITSNSLCTLHNVLLNKLTCTITMYYYYFKLTLHTTQCIIITSNSLCTLHNVLLLLQVRHHHYYFSFNSLAVAKGNDNSC